jgi:hypothetical protein
MDLYCPRCAEPWDNECLHDEVAARKRSGDEKATYNTVASDFRVKGCNALATEYGKQTCERTNSMRAQAASVMYDLLGDDMDGAASMLDDFEFMGMLD